MIEEFSELGYDLNIFYSVVYDWCLSFMMLECWDGYFIWFKSVIEMLYLVYGECVVLFAYSYGDMIFRYFFEWVEIFVVKGGGGGGKWWVDKYVYVYVDIVGFMLGILKMILSLLSGEM